jgi:hypothetical protein
VVLYVLATIAVVDVAAVLFSGTSPGREACEVTEQAL